MITRLEQKALFDSLGGDLKITTTPDGNGDDVTIPVHVYWGFEPVENELPAIIAYFQTYNIPREKTLANLWKITPEGDFIGYLADYMFKIKIKTSDYGDISTDNYIEKVDISNALLQRTMNKIFLEWDGLIDDGSIPEDGISPVDDVSEIFDLETIRELQFTVKITKLTGAVPTENGTVKFATAPTIEAVGTNINYEQGN